MKVLSGVMFGKSSKPTGTKLDAWSLGMGIAMYAQKGWAEYMLDLNNLSIKLCLGDPAGESLQGGKARARGPKRRNWNSAPCRLRVCAFRLKHSLR